jgi:hypothetical protein
MPRGAISGTKDAPAVTPPEEFVNRIPEVSSSISGKKHYKVGKATTAKRSVRKRLAEWIDDEGK